MIKNKNGNEVLFDGQKQLKCPNCCRTWMIPDWNWHIYWCVMCHFNEREVKYA